MSKVPVGGGKFLKGTEIKEGEVAVIKDEANWVTGEYKGQETNQYTATVEYKGEDRTLKFTKLSRQNLLPLGEDSKEWIGKPISLQAVDVMVDGKMYKTIVATPHDAKDVNAAIVAKTEAIKPEDVAWDE